ncbi:hypothetical protein KP509_36G026000 [Ceratopteris richardii]|uniref:Dihydrolipoamide acetyltransferase component of pyruvate dehydrogenase complex n=1 Tax=Ceratopteris richardii TaxID=49495 RepID=A0A8T2QBZ8_CERRI|nr:hypothetical protein KP509_36G026000 [Ceratopteris richardii]
MESLMSSPSHLCASSFLGNRRALSVPLVSAPSHPRVTGGRLRVEARVREIFMPALSSTMTEGKIVSWSKSEGDKLTKGDSVVVVESDKADMDVETFYDGILAAIIVGEGEVAPVGAAIGLLAETEDEIAEAKSKAAAATPSSSSQSSAASAPAAETVTPSSPASTPTSTPTPIPTLSPAPSTVSIHDGPQRIVATPYAKKLAKQYKVNIDTVVGTGPYGRITATDVEAAAGKAPAAKPQTIIPLSASPAPSPAPSVATSKPAPQAVSGAAAVPGTVVPFTTMQAAVSRNMVESLNVPTFRVGYTVYTDALDALYKKVKSKGVTMTALLAKAVAVALAQHPVVNASCKDGKSFTYNSDINIAVAVAMDGGLLTPVLQNADKVDLYALSSKWKELVDKARAKQLQPHEYNSGTFTLSNLGMFGVDRFDAILPPGTGAIMAVGASQKKVVATSNGMLGVKSQMQVNVTADHRIIYGAELAAFLQTFAKILDNPDDLTL